MAIALHALLVYTVVAVRRIDRKDIEAWPTLFSGGVCGGSATGGERTGSHQACRAQCADSTSCDVYCHGAGGRKGDWACLFFDKDLCDSSAQKSGKRWRGYTCYSRPPGPVCDLEKPVFISSADTGLFLTDAAMLKGTVWEQWYLGTVESRVSKTLTLHKATEPASGFYLSTHRGMLIQSHRSDCDEDGWCDEDIKFVRNRGLWETWSIIEAGDGHVFIEDFEKNGLSEGFNWGDGKLVGTSQWNPLKWTITRQDGSPACRFDGGGSLPSLAQPALAPATTARAANIGAANASTASAGAADSVSR